MSASTAICAISSTGFNDNNNKLIISLIAQTAVEALIEGTTKKVYKF